MRKQLIAGATAVAVLAPVAGAGAQSSYYYPVVKITPGLTIKVKPKRDRKKPYKFAVSGQVQRKGAAKPAACKGKVTIRFKVNGKTVASGQASVKASTCKYARTFKVKKKAKKIKVSAKFGGNTVLKAKSSKTVTVRAG